MEINELKSSLKARVAKGLNFGIEAVEEVIAEHAAVYNQFVLLKSKYNDLMYLSSINTLPYDQIEIGLDRLRHHLLLLIDEIHDEALKQHSVNSNLKVQALPTRRTNFFKLLDIHFQNLAAIHHSISFGEGDTTNYFGRAAIYQIYDSQSYHFKRMQKEQPSEELRTLSTFFTKLFTKDTGAFEVYFKNIKHMLTYIFESDIEQQFFLNTLQSLLSRYELALLFYYSLCEIDTEFKPLIIKSELFTKAIKPTLIQENHFEFLS